MAIREIDTHTDFNWGDCEAQEGRLPTRCLLKDNGFCKKHKGEQNMECSCPLDEDGFGIIIFKKLELDNAEKS